MSGIEASWAAFDIAVWGFGARSALSLRSTDAGAGRVWAALFWALWACALREAAGLGAARLPGLDLASSAAGIAAAGLMALSVHRLLEAIAPGSPAAPVAEGWDRFVGGALSAAMLAAFAIGQAWPAGAAFPGSGARLAEGLLWLAVSVWSVRRLWRAARRTPKDAAEPYGARRLAAAFAVSALRSALEVVLLISGAEALRGPVRALWSLFMAALVLLLQETALRKKALQLESELRDARGLPDNEPPAEAMAAAGAVAGWAARGVYEALSAVERLAESALAETRLPGRVWERLRDIRQAARDGGPIASSLLGVIRRAQGRPRSLREAVERPLDSLAGEFARRRIQVVRVIEDVPLVPADLALVSQACLCLYLNARDALRESGGTLKVGIAVRGGRAVIEVSDDGAGISRELVPVMFEPFQTTKAAPISGLGLAASRAIIREMGGDLDCSSGAGRGATFRILLPLGSVSAASSRPDAGPETASPEPEARLWSE